MQRRVLGELYPCRGQAADDSADGYLQHLGDLAIGQAFNIGEEYAFALGFGQRVDAPDHLSREDVGLRRIFTVKRQGVVSPYHALALTRPARSDLVEPDRMQNAQQPTIPAGARNELPGTLERPYAGGLDQFFGDMPLPGQQQAVAP